MGAAGKAEPEDLHSIYMVWKDILMKQGKGSSLARVKRLAKSLRAHYEATYNAFDLCDIAGWLHDWGEKPYAAGLWEAAKNVSKYDQCVREDWAKWEGRE